MMTAGARQSRRWPFGAAARMLLPLVLALSVLVLFSIVWQSVGEQSDFAKLERDGVKYIQALGPLEIALTNAESAAVNGGPAAPDELAGAIEAVARVDNELRGRLGTQDRWAGLRTKIESLPDGGTDPAIIAAYGGAHDLLLALLDKVRNTSKLIRDPDADIYYLGDGATQELPEGIVAAARFTDLLVSIAGLPAADRPQALVDINSAGSDLAGNARDLSDDVRLAVEGTGSRSLGGALLSRLDRFNRAIDNLTPLMSPVLTGKGGVNTAQVVRARNEMQVAAAELSAALLTQIDIGLSDRLSSLSQRRLLAVVTLVVPLLIALVPAGIALAARRRRGTTPRGQDRPETTPRAPAHQAPAQQAAPPPWPADPVPAQWPAPGPQPATEPEYARWERFGAPR
jgi:hypothetical protein